jgi:multidrug transporter EmrE-like cation transporter
MSLPQIIGLTLVEVIGDFSLKRYANEGGLMPLVTGVVGYFGVMIMLIISLQGSTVLMVNAGWDGISAIIESICAYIFLGERLDNYMQYIGIVFVIVGMYLLKIPWSKSHPFAIPKI